jgi:IS30 family transposase
MGIIGGVVSTSAYARHRRFTLTTNIDAYFCDPQSPWQRGSNENTNGLLRQYFPKGTDLSVHSQAHLNKVASAIRPRRRGDRMRRQIAAVHESPLGT